MYSASLSQPESLKQNDEDDSFGGSFSLSQPNLTLNSYLTSPDYSPRLSSFQSNIRSPPAIMMTSLNGPKSFNNNENNTLQNRNHDGNSFSSSKVISIDNFKHSNYYVSPITTPKIVSPVLSNDALDSFSPSIKYYPLSPDHPGRKNSSYEKRGRKKSVVHALENIIEPNHQLDPVQNEIKKSKYERNFDEYQLGNNKKCKVLYEGQFNRWIEEDPYSIYSDDVIRFSTKPSSTIEQRNDLSFERIVSQNNNGYWQKNNFLITKNEIILFPNGKWDNRVVEVMTITDDINISISSILIARLEWIIEVKTIESNVYTQSNFIYQTSQAHHHEKEAKSNHGDSVESKMNKDAKLGSEKNSNKTNNASTTSNSSRSVQWILKFYDRESMLYFISLIKYIQTKKSNRLANEEKQAWDILESDISSFSSSEDNEEKHAALTKSMFSSLPLETKPTNKFETAFLPTFNYATGFSFNSNELGQNSHPPRRERTSSLGEHYYNPGLERKGSTKKTSPFSPVLETKGEYSEFNLRNKSTTYLKSQQQQQQQQPNHEEKRTTKDLDKKGLEALTNDVNALLKDSIQKAELEIMKLQNWSNNRPHSSINNGVGSTSVIKEEEEKEEKEAEEEKKENRGSEGEKEEKEKHGNKSLSSPKTNWQGSRDRTDRTRRSKINNWNPNSSAAIFTNIQLSYLDMLENKAKNKIIKLNKSSTATSKDTTVQTKSTNTENPITEEESNSKTENSKLKTYSVPPQRHRRSSSLTQTFIKDNEFIARRRDSFSAGSKIHPMALPLSSPSSKYNSISTDLTGISDGSSSNILRKGSLTGMSNNSSFYSPRSSSLFMDDINILQKNSQKRISGVFSPDMKSNSMLSASAGSEIPVVDQKSLNNDFNLFQYGISSNDSDGPIQRHSIQSNGSHNSLDSSGEAIGYSTSKSTPDVGQVLTVLQKNGLEGIDLPIPPIKEDDYSTPSTGVKNTITPPRRSSSYHRVCNSTGSINMMEPSLSLSQPLATITTSTISSSSNHLNPNTAVTEGRSRSGSKTFLYSLYRSNSARSARSTRKGFNTYLDTNVKLSNNGHVSSTSMTPLDTKDSDNPRMSNKDNDMNKNEAFYTSDINYHPYMMDLKSSNELYLASLQQQIQQQQQQQQQRQFSMMPNSPPLNNSNYSSVLVSPTVPGNTSFSNSHINIHSQPQSPVISHIQPNTFTGGMNDNNYDSSFSSSSKSLLLKYSDSQNQLVTVDLNDESIIPTSFLKNYPKNNSTTVNPVIRNSLKILNILEQTYL
ncbi:hypothetical protein BCR36DRAFT_582343 [Piromyces finnis]|uniref:Uncharacterized protein n=1 Tax=Piromyces finnis TaxID=1754191 RepID=A0A1Y1VCX7_9FUNG|nr:hypothetical protein BCR36DRAFT_582343 [Piromyces finnis]|eukprot:ORX52939.1 hypothetical protein BCR36DRAFT_582343 [Piromyces finnis]